MNYTNEEIARAAGLDDAGQFRQWTCPLCDVECAKDATFCRLAKGATYDKPIAVTPVNKYIGPDWANDPGAVATWLLPVLEKRWPEYVTTRSFTPADPSKEILDCATEFPYAIWQSEFRIGDGSNGVTAPTWHLAVIEAIMATAEGGK